MWETLWLELPQRKGGVEEKWGLGSIRYRLVTYSLSKRVEFSSIESFLKVHHQYFGRLWLTAFLGQRLMPSLTASPTPA